MGVGVGVGVGMGKTPTPLLLPCFGIIAPKSVLSIGSNTLVFGLRVYRLDGV